MRFKQGVILYSYHKDLTDAVRQYRITRQNIFRWRRKYDGNLRSLADGSHRPHSHPNQHTEAELNYQDVRQRSPHDGLATFWIRLRQRSYTGSISGLYKILRRIDGKPIKFSNPRYAPKPYGQLAYPGQKWQIDVKYVPSSCLVGATMEDAEKNGDYYYQYTFIDKYSRFRYLEAFKKKNTYTSTMFSKAYG